jgi:pimeloyl-ACP methyl ester carboxylesterase
MALAALVGCAGCGAGPSSRPGVAVQRSGQSGGSSTTSTAPSRQPPAIGVPRSDLAWTDCTRQTLDQLGLGAGPAGLVLECAQFTAPIDITGAVYGTTTVGALRARLATTPANAAPVVFTSGTDRASTATLAAMASAGSTQLLAAHPVVAVDRRGIGASAALNCIPADVHTQLADNAQGQPGDPVDTMASLSTQATSACKDFLEPQDLTYDAAHAADDIDQLRQQWQVNRIALIGTGDGALVAGGYAAKYPDRLARLVLDSPNAFGENQQAVTEQRAQGEEAALTAFAQRCVALHCSLGSDPRAAVTALVANAAAGQVPDASMRDRSAPSLLSASAVLTAVSGFLGSPRGDQSDRVPELADALSAAGRGEVTALRALADKETDAKFSDGQFVSWCSDLQQRVPLQQIPGLRSDWGRKYPVFGDQAALGMATCSAWATMDPPSAPRTLKMPVLLFSGASDPVVGNGGIGTVTGALGASGSPLTVVAWQGYGHPALAHSGCAQQLAVHYLDSDALPPGGAACPA